MKSMPCLMVVGVVPGREWLEERLAERGYAGTADLDVGTYAVRAVGGLDAKLVPMIEVEADGSLLVPGCYRDWLGDHGMECYVVEEPALLCPGVDPVAETRARAALLSLTAVGA
jgi:hypothetical protein